MSSEARAAARRGRIELRRFAGPAAYMEQLAHLRVAHLTDLHVGRVTPLRVHHAAIALTNEQHPDLVVLTGDFVCHSQLYLDELTEVVSAIEAPVVCVLGNHDYWSGADEVRWALRRAGAEILDNRNTLITLRHQRIQLIGLDDAYTGHAQRHRATKGLRKDLPALALSHIAEEADALWEQGIPLVLAGHTHGGQVTVARLHELAIGRLAGHRYVHGLYGTRRKRKVGAGAQGADAAGSRADGAPANGDADGAARDGGPAHGAPWVSRGASGASVNGVAPDEDDSVGDGVLVHEIAPLEPIMRLDPTVPFTSLGAVYVGAGIGAAIMPFRIGERGRREVTIFELGHEPGSFEEHHDEQPALPGRKPSGKTQYKRHAAVVAKANKRERRRAQKR